MYVGCYFQPELELLILTYDIYIDTYIYTYIYREL